MWAISPSGCQTKPIQSESNTQLDAHRFVAAAGGPGANRPCLARRVKMQRLSTTTPGVPGRDSCSSDCCTRSADRCDKTTLVGLGDVGGSRDWAQQTFLGRADLLGAAGWWDLFPGSVCVSCSCGSGDCYTIWSVVSAGFFILWLKIEREKNGCCPVQWMLVARYLQPGTHSSDERIYNFHPPGVGKCFYNSFHIINLIVRPQLLSSG